MDTSALAQARGDVDCVHHRHISGLYPGNCSFVLQSTTRSVPKDSDASQYSSDCTDLHNRYKSAILAGNWFDDRLLCTSYGVCWA